MSNLDNDLNIPRRTEEVQHIIERMPTNFGYIVTGIVSIIFFLILVFGWLIRYPDVIKGQISINSGMSPIKLIAGTNGKLKLGKLKTGEQIKEGQIIGYIENPTSPYNILFIDSLLKTYKPNSNSIIGIAKKLPSDFSAGELNSKYYTFLNSIQELTNYKVDKLFDKQITSYKKILVEQNYAIRTAQERLRTGENSLKYAHKFFQRDSLLFLKRIISEAEFDKSQMTYNASKDNYQSNLNNLITSRQQAQTTESKIEEIYVQNPEKEKEVMANVVSSYNDLIDNIKIWEQKYLFKAPFEGRLQFLKFWTDNQYVQGGEEVFTVIPKNGYPQGQMTLPANGAGKVKVGQEAIVKLDDYPYNEYGSIKGIVKSISITTNATKTDQGNINNYLVFINFPQKLKTNYGTTLNFKFESKGISEIITNDRRLIERLFDNLKYITN